MDDTGVPSALRPRWSCDVCGLDTFYDYEEACRHEEQCQGAVAEATILSSEDKDHHHEFVVVAYPSDTRSSSSCLAAVPPSLVANADADASTVFIDKKNTNQVKVKKRTEINNKQEEVPAGDPKTKRQKILPINLASIFNSTPSNKEIINSTGSKQVLKDSNMAKKRTNKPTSSPKSDPTPPSVTPINTIQKTKRQKSEKQNTAKATATATKKMPRTATTSTKKSNNAPLAAIFQVHHIAGEFPVDEQALLAEQRTVELQAKLRKERENEQERQRRRQEIFFPKKSSSSSSNSRNATTTTTAKKQSRFSCPRFPVPSFVHPASPPSENTTETIVPTKSFHVVSEEQLTKARLTIQKELPFTGRIHLQFATEEEETPWTWTYSPPPPSLLATLHSPFNLRLAKIMAGQSSTQRIKGNSALWVDAYSLMDTDNICGAQNKSAANVLIAFVRDWMVHRQDANERMAERQKALLKKRATKKKKKSSNDDIWFDSDNEDNESLSRVCLLEGDVGSGKSSLVYAVARHCGCNVIELNTSDKRGSADIRKILEEATRSHSSLTMLKQREANLFAQQEQQSHLVDSEGDSDDEGHLIEKKGSTLTIILIDEGMLVTNRFSKLSPCSNALLCDRFVVQLTTSLRKI
jgi:ATPase family associated with various cellular activities (AAA)